jgi:hypothetical protein
MSNSQVPRIELNQDDTINLVVNVYGFDAGTPIEISGQATQNNGAVATFYSLQNMPASKEEDSAVLRVESVPAVPPNKFVAGFPITVVLRVAEAWITTLEADTDPGALQSYAASAGSHPLNAAWKASSYQAAVLPNSHPSAARPQAIDPAMENRFLPQARTNWSGKVLASARRVDGDVMVGELKVWFEPKTVHSNKELTSVVAPPEVSSTPLIIQDGGEGTHAEFVITISGGEEMSVFPRRQVARVPTDTASEEYIFKLLASGGMKSREASGSTTGETRAGESAGPVVEAMTRINHPILVDISMAGRTVQVIETHMR